MEATHRRALGFRAWSTPVAGVLGLNLKSVGGVRRSRGGGGGGANDGRVEKSVTPAEAGPGYTNASREQIVLVAVRRGGTVVAYIYIYIDA